MYQKANVEAYAYALFSLALKNDELDKIKQAWFDFNTACELNDKFKNALSNKAISRREKFSYLDQIMGDLNLDTLLNFFKVLIERDTFNLIDRIYSKFRYLVNEHKGIKEAFIYTTKPLNITHKMRFKHYLESKYKTQIELHNIIDPSLIGGFKIQIDCDVIEQNLALDLIKLSKIIAHKGA